MDSSLFGFAGAKLMETATLTWVKASACLVFGYVNQACFINIFEAFDIKYKQEKTLYCNPYFHCGTQVLNVSSVTLNHCCCEY